jgi:hypothetical protein
MATFHNFHILRLNNDGGELDAKSEVVASPIDNEGKYIASPPVFAYSSGLPMHADLLYEKPFTKGEVQTSYRKYASKLAKLANYYADPNPTSADWQGDRLSWKDNSSHG